MCVQYWPANTGTSDEYFGIKVELLKEEELANFQMRTLKVTKNGEVSYSGNIGNVFLNGSCLNNMYYSFYISSVTSNGDLSYSIAESISNLFLYY